MAKKTFTPAELSSLFRKRKITDDDIEKIEPGQILRISRCLAVTKDSSLVEGRSTHGDTDEEVIFFATVRYVENWQIGTWPSMSVEEARNKLEIELIQEIRAGLADVEKQLKEFNSACKVIREYAQELEDIHQLKVAQASEGTQACFDVAGEARDVAGEARDSVATMAPKVLDLSGAGGLVDHDNNPGVMACSPKICSRGCNPNVDSTSDAVLVEDLRATREGLTSRGKAVPIEIPLASVLKAEDLDFGANPKHFKLRSANNGPGEESLAEFYIKYVFDPNLIGVGEDAANPLHGLSIANAYKAYEAGEVSCKELVDHLRIMGYKVAKSSLKQQRGVTPTRVRKAKDSPENREFWHAASEASKTVEAWPAWKRGEFSMVVPKSSKTEE